MPKELYMCQLCANQLMTNWLNFNMFFTFSGHYNQPKKGHKRSCPNRNCTWVCLPSPFVFILPFGQFCRGISHWHFRHAIIRSKLSSGVHSARWMPNGVLWTKWNANGGMGSQGTIKSMGQMRCEQLLRRTMGKQVGMPFWWKSWESPILLVHSKTSSMPFFLVGFLTIFSFSTPFDWPETKPPVVSQLIKTSTQATGHLLARFMPLGLDVLSQLDGRQAEASNGQLFQAKE